MKSYYQPLFLFLESYFPLSGPLVESQQVDILAPDTLIVTEEFGDWENCRRRIGLLGIDKDANLIVIELKRSEVRRPYINGSRINGCPLTFEQALGKFNNKVADLHP